MKINEILFEAQVTPYTAIVGDVKDFPQDLQKYCSEALSIGFLDFPIWRGFRDIYEEYYYLDPSTGVRKSQNTSNHYTILMDNSPYMKGWPKRSNSFISSSGTRYAGGFGEMYMLVPYNGTKIAVCPDTDFWDTPIEVPELHFYSSNGRGMDALNYFLKTQLGLKSDSFQSMIESTKTPEFEEKLQVLTTYCKPHEVIPLLWKHLAPAVNGLRLLSMSEYVSERPVDKEVWFSGPCLGITKTAYDLYYQE